VRKPRQYRGGYNFSGLRELTRELRAKETEAEVLLWKLLRNRQLLGLKFRRQRQFGDYVTSNVTVQRMNTMGDGITIKTAMPTWLLKDCEFCASPMPRF